MPLQIIRNDITKMKVDAIVNATDTSLSGSGGVDGSIHRTAGPGLSDECRKLHGCAAGSAEITGGYRLPCRFVIHTVGPEWQDGLHGENEILASCYRSALALAEKHGCGTIAFPLISSGICGYPRDLALRTAVDTISEFLTVSDMTVYIVIFDRKTYRIGEKLFADITEYIDDNYADEQYDEYIERMRRRRTPARVSESLGEQSYSRRSFYSRSRLSKSYLRDYSKSPEPREDEDSSCKSAHSPEHDSSCKSAHSPEHDYSDRKSTLPPDDEDFICRSMLSPDDEDFICRSMLSPDDEASMCRSMLSLDDALEQIDESFSEMLMRKIDESGMSDSECYKKANIDRKLFSKIRSDKLYKPSKPTVLAFAIALELPLYETKEMLMKAGFALSHSSKFDIIVEYFIERGNYNIFEINEALFAFDQRTLGA